MLTPQDDLIGHQSPAPFAMRVGHGDERFAERWTSRPAFRRRRNGRVFANVTVCCRRT